MGLKGGLRDTVSNVLDPVQQLGTPFIGQNDQIRIVRFHPLQLGRGGVAGYR